MRQQILGVAGAQGLSAARTKGSSSKTLSSRARGLNKVLRELERSGEIARIRKNRYVLPAEADLVTGKLSIHQAGYGFLVTDRPGEPDIFVAAAKYGHRDAWRSRGSARHSRRSILRERGKIDPPLLRFGARDG